MLIAKKVKISAQYSDFSDVFLEEKALVLLEITNLKQYAMKLQEGQQPFYWLIYNLGPVELKMLKTYIKINLANNFIRSLKSLANAPIFFVWKPDGNFCLYVNYQGLNNLTIKN